MSVDLQDLSRRLFQTANQLWTNTALRPDQYAQPVLALIALRQMETKFDLIHAEIAPTFTGRLKPKPADYHGRGAVFVPDNARFSYLLGLPETENLAEALNEAMRSLTEHNPDLVGVMPHPPYVFWLLQHHYESRALLAFHTQHTGVARFQFTTFSNNFEFELPPPRNPTPHRVDPWGV